MTKVEIKEFVYQVKEFEIQKETDKGIEVYDYREDKFFNYRYLEDLDIEEVFQFNSLPFDKEAFLRVFRDCVDINMLIIIDKIVFINNVEEYKALIEEYPEQSMDLKRNVGIHFYMDNVVVINVKRIKELIDEEMRKFYFLNLSYQEELAIGLWHTLIHELRHSITANPIILEDMIPIAEGEEDKVEEYCRKVYKEVIEKHTDYCCFR